VAAVQEPHVPFLVRQDPPGHVGDRPVTGAPRGRVLEMSVLFGLGIRPSWPVLCPGGNGHVTTGLLDRCRRAPGGQACVPGAQETAYPVGRGCIGRTAGGSVHAEGEHAVGVDANADVGVEKILPLRAVARGVKVQQDPTESRVGLRLHVEDHGLAVNGH
jgi:hypothetical protein